MDKLSKSFMNCDYYFFTNQSSRDKDSLINLFQESEKYSIDEIAEFSD